MGTGRHAVVTVAALGIALAGCAQTVQPAHPVAAPPDRSATFREAVDRTTASSFVVTVKADTHESVVAIDPAGGRRQSTTTHTSEEGDTITVRVRVIGEDTFFNIAGNPTLDPKEWFRIDTGKTDGTPLAIEPDAGLVSLADNAHAVQVRANTLTGTILMTDPRPSTRTELMGPERMALLFTATVAEDGRLADIATDGRVIGVTGLTATYTFSGYGDPVVVEPPPAAVTGEAPPELVEGLTGG